MNGNEREEVKMEECKETAVYMWGYLPGALPDKLSTVRVRLSASIHGGASSWKDVCGGGCGFAMAISELDCGKLITWGSTDDEGQSYLTSGKHGETPEPFPLPTEASIVKAAAGWAHCVSVTDTGEVYTWGWKECVPLVKVTHDLITGGSFQKDIVGKQSTFQSEQVSPKSRGLNVSGGTISQTENRKAGEEMAKRRRISVAKGEQESLTSGDEFFTLSPCVVTLGPGVRMRSVAAGGRHTLVLSDAGALLKFGWGLYEQCGQGSTTDLLRPTCISSLSCIQVAGVAAGLWHTVCIDVDGQVYTFGGNQFGQLGTDAEQVETSPKRLDAASLEGKHAKMVSFGARHSTILTDDGQVLSWGWNKYGQLGLDDTIDRNISAQVPIDGCQPKHIACGWWHTLLLAETPI
ncbi:ultraviolet-B receptor UVR8-like isoform X6 [Durio zibethinus]|uniref:Ultraviolet-B receptor UVR8-like isoform X6 n=1 Tax=Durio zibethinus TaxID=66656 RepID=A0A6P6AS48_DURZI|nr:ultraviolet-B receptor UVR8-like isoform X6 [Durio zibethinus]